MEETPLDRIDQLAGATQQTASEVETVGAEVTDLRGRVAELEGQLAEMRKAQEASAAQLERLTSRLQSTTRLDALEEQLGAARAAEERTAERVESLASEMVRLGHVEEALGHIRREVTERIGQHEEALKRELTQTRTATRSDTQTLHLDLSQQQMRHDALAKQMEQIASREHRYDELTSLVTRLEVRIEEVADARAQIEELALRVEQETARRVAALGGDLEGLQEEVGRWSARIERQEETVRRAETISARAKQDAERLREEHAQMVEAQRVAEAQVERALASIRQEQADRWATFLERQDREQEQAQRDLTEREKRQHQRLEDLLDNYKKRTDTQFHELDGRIERHAGALDEFRQAVTEIVVRWRDDHEDAVKALAAIQPGSARPAMLEERRSALRRAMRARSDTAGDR